MTPLQSILLACAAHAVLRFVLATSDAAYPPPYGLDQSSATNCAPSDLVPIRRDVYGGGRIIDISHRYHSHMPAWESSDGIGNFLWLAMSMKNGSLGNMPLKICPALLVDVPRDKNITAEVMKSLNIPERVTRVLFKTLNTDRGLMYQKEFDTSFVGFTKDGARWLVDNTGVKLVGLDYLSVAAYDDAIPTHHVFLQGRDIILVEGLKLDDVEAGLYSVHCLPLRLVDAEGSPVRCILIK